MSTVMKFTSSSGEEMRFDDFVDNTEEYNSYWASLCYHCHNQFKDILAQRIDDCGSGICSVKGCDNEADYYVDFDKNEVSFEEEN